MAGLFWLTDAQWAVISPFMPMHQPGARRVDDRRVLSGIIHVLGTGCRWRDCPAGHGPAGAFSGQCSPPWPGRLVAHDGGARQHLRRGPPFGAGGKGGGADAGQRPVADRSHDANRLRRDLREAGIIPILPGTRVRKRPIRHDKRRYQDHWRVEAAICRLEGFRRVATRGQILRGLWHERCRCEAEREKFHEFQQPDQFWLWENRWYELEKQIITTQARCLDDLRGKIELMRFYSDSTGSGMEDNLAASIAAGFGLLFPRR